MKNVVEKQREEVAAHLAQHAHDEQAAERADVLHGEVDRVRAARGVRVLPEVHGGHDGAAHDVAHGDGEDHAVDLLLLGLHDEQHEHLEHERQAVGHDVHDHVLEVPLLHAEQVRHVVAQAERDEGREDLDIVVVRVDALPRVDGGEEQAAQAAQHAGKQDRERQVQDEGVLHVEIHGTELFQMQMVHHERGRRVGYKIWNESAA